eukprot:1946727-Rhodomonas_salina.1
MKAGFSIKAEPETEDALPAQPTWRQLQMQNSLNERPYSRAEYDDKVQEFLVKLQPELGRKALRSSLKSQVQMQCPDLHVELSDKHIEAQDLSKMGREAEADNLRKYILVSLRFFELWLVKPYGQNNARRAFGGHMDTRSEESVVEEVVDLASEEDLVIDVENQILDFVRESTVLKTENVQPEMDNAMAQAAGKTLPSAQEPIAGKVSTPSKLSVIPGAAPVAGSSSVTSYSSSFSAVEGGAAGSTRCVITKLSLATLTMRSDGTGGNLRPRTGGAALRMAAIQDVSTGGAEPVSGKRKMTELEVTSALNRATEKGKEAKRR